MAKRIALCLDEKSCCNPALVGLDGERLDAQAWLQVFSEGAKARDAIKGGDAIDEVWVVSCEDVDPINLAATLKSDKPGLPVKLVASEMCGSLFSRAHTAHIDEVLQQSAFVKLYAQTKQVVLEPPAFQREAVHARTTQEQPKPASVRVLPKGFVMPVVSGSGGAGKSSVSLVAAYCAAARGLKTLLLDCDLQFGDIAFMAGLESPLAVDEAISQPERLEREITGEGNLAILAAPARLENAEEVVKGLPRLLEVLTSRFDVIVMNTGAAWAEQHAVLLERSSASLFLIDQRMSSVRACRHALELCARCGIASGPFRFALNRCAKGAPLTSLDVSSVLDGAPVFELRDGSREVEDCLSSGSIEELFQANNEFVLSVDHVMEQLLPALQQPSHARGDLDGSLLSMRRRGRHSGKRKARRQ